MVLRDITGRLWYTWYNVISLITTLLHVATDVSSIVVVFMVSWQSLIRKPTRLRSRMITTVAYSACEVWKMLCAPKHIQTTIGNTLTMRWEFGTWNTLISLCQVGVCDRHGPTMYIAHILHVACQTYGNWVASRMISGLYKMLSRDSKHTTGWISGVPTIRRELWSFMW